MASIYGDWLSLGPLLSSDAAVLNLSRRTGRVGRDVDAEVERLNTKVAESHKLLCLPSFEDSDPAGSVSAIFILVHGNNGKPCDMDYMAQIIQEQHKASA